MNHKLVMTLTLMVLMAGLMLSAPMARADSLTLTVTSPTGQYHVGDTINFLGTITADGGNSAAVSLIGISDTIIPGGGNFTFDDSPFFNNTPASLNPGESFTGVLFALTVGAGTQNQFYTNTPSLLADDSAGAQFTVDASGPAATFGVPEPASMLLLGFGLTGLAGMMRRKR